MSYTVTRYPTGTFCWADVMSTDFAATKKFMTELMGWQAEDLPTDKEGVTYTMFTKDGKNVAGGGQIPSSMNMPSAWANYISVDKLETYLDKIESLGGKIEMPAMDVMEAGRMAGIQDPAGAIVHLWEPKNHIGASLVNTVGAMGWNELRSSDPAVVKKFYADLFGWEIESNDDSYSVIKNQGRMNGGMMQLDPAWGAPSHWATYFTVADIEATVKLVRELGGSVQGEIIDSPEVGRIALVQDPAGANFVTIEMDVEPDHWEE